MGAYRRAAFPDLLIPRELSQPREYKRNNDPAGTRLLAAGTIVHCNTSERPFGVRQHAKRTGAAGAELERGKFEREWSATHDRLDNESQIAEVASDPPLDTWITIPPRLHSDGACNSRERATNNRGISEGPGK